MLDQLTLHLKEGVKVQNVFFDVLLGKIGLVWLDAEMFVQSLFILSEESPDFLDSSIFYEWFLIL